MKTLKECLIWIEEQGVANKFIYNYEKQKVKSLEDFLINLVKESNVRSLFHHAFVWSHTPEGANFWSSLSCKYQTWFDK